MGNPDFRVGNRIFATLASQKLGYGNLMITPDQQAAFVIGAPGRLPADRRRLGPHGHDAHPPGSKPAKMS